MKRLDIINKRLPEKNKARAFEYFEYLKKKYLKKKYTCYSGYRPGNICSIHLS